MPPGLTAPAVRQRLDNAAVKSPQARLIGRDRFPAERTLALPLRERRQWRSRHQEDECLQARSVVEREIKVSERIGQIVEARRDLGGRRGMAKLDLPVRIERDQVAERRGRESRMHSHVVVEKDRLRRVADRAEHAGKLVAPEMFHLERLDPHGGGR